MEGLEAYMIKNLISQRGPGRSAEDTASDRASDFGIISGRRLLNSFTGFARITMGDNDFSENCKSNSSPESECETFDCDRLRHPAPYPSMPGALTVIARLAAGLVHKPQIENVLNPHCILQGKGASDYVDCALCSLTVDMTQRAAG